MHHNETGKLGFERKEQGMGTRKIENSVPT
jgi:hypothetical protein